MKWFRLYSEIIDDPKCCAASMDSETFRNFILLMAYAAELGTGGEIYKNTDTIAWRLRISKDRLERSIKTLSKLRIIRDNPNVAFLNWGKRQFLSDESTERVKKYRQKRIESGMPAGASYNRDTVIACNGYRCVYCGSEKNLCVDHVLPINLGGTDDPDNLVAACKECNSGKSGRTPEMAGFEWKNQESKQRYKTYLKRLQEQGVTVTVTPPDTDTDTESDTEIKTVPEKSESQAQAEGLCQELLTAIQQADPEFKAKSWGRWVLDMERMIRLDNRPPAEISQVIQASRKDQFWSTVIFSASNLREHYPKILARMKNGGTHGTNRRHSNSRDPREFDDVETGKITTGSPMPTVPDEQD